jgi:thiol-disulfide isomerase/thioredoxin
LENIQSIGATLYSAAANDIQLGDHSQNLMVVTGAVSVLSLFSSASSYLPRPVLVYHRDGRVRSTIDLVALSADIKWESHVLALIQDDLDRQHNETVMLCSEEDAAAQASSTFSSTFSSTSASFKWVNDQTKLLNEILSSDIFETPNVLMIGLFHNAPDTTHQGWPARAFQHAANMWSKNNPTVGEENESESSSSSSSVLFLGTYDSEVARHVRQHLMNDGAAVVAAEVDDEEGQPHESHVTTLLASVVALKRAENVMLWMSLSDLDSIAAMLDHVRTAQSMTPRLEFSRYTPETSRQIWGLSNEIYVLVIIDETVSSNTAAIVEQQKMAVESVASGLPAAHFSIVPRISSNEGILKFLDILVHPREYLIPDGGAGSPANVIIVDRSEKHMKKYRLYPDFIPTTTVRLKSNDLKSFMKKFSSKQLSPHWKSEPKASTPPPVDGGVVAVSGSDLQSIMTNQADEKDIILSFEASWCRTCTALTPKLKEAASLVQKKFPNRLHFLSVNLEKNEIDHILSSISLRQQPWQYTMPLIWIPHDGKHAENLPWRGTRGVVPINEDELLKFLDTKDGFAYDKEKRSEL